MTGISPATTAKTRVTRRPIAERRSRMRKMAMSVAVSGQLQRRARHTPRKLKEKRNIGVPSAISPS